MLSVADQVAHVGEGLFLEAERVFKEQGKCEDRYSLLTSSLTFILLIASLFLCVQLEKKQQANRVFVCFILQFSYQSYLYIHSVEDILCSHFMFIPASNLCSNLQYE